MTAVDAQALAATVQRGIITCHCSIVATDPECSGCAADVALRGLVEALGKAQQDLDVARGEVVEWKLQAWKAHYGVSPVPRKIPPVPVRGDEQ